MSNYYFQTRNGVKVRVRKGRNRVRFHKGRKITRATVRGAIPIKKGEFYGKGAVVINARGKSIKGDEGVSIRRRKGVVVAAGKLGKVKGGIAIGYKKGRATEAIADYSNNREYVSFSAEFPTLAKFAQSETHYRRRSKKGKITLVRKGRKKALKKLVLGTAALVGGGLAANYLLKKGIYSYANKVKRPTGTPVVDDIDKYFG